MAQPVELILARNLISSIELAAFLVDPDATIVYFNDAAGELIGRRFEEVGRLTREDWADRFGPFDEFGKLLPTDALPSTRAMTEGLPAHGEVHVRIDEDHLRKVEVSALPLTTAEGFQGAIVVFWASDDGGG